MSQLDGLVNANRSDNKTLHLDPKRALFVPAQPDKAASVSQSRSACSRQADVCISERFLEALSCLFIL